MIFAPKNLGKYEKQGYIREKPYYVDGDKCFTYELTEKGKKNKTVVEECQEFIEALEEEKKEFLKHVNG